MARSRSLSLCKVDLRPGPHTPGERWVRLSLTLQVAIILTILLIPVNQCLDTYKMARLSQKHLEASPKPYHGDTTFKLGEPTLKLPTQPFPLLPEESTPRRSPPSLGPEAPGVFP